MAELMPCNARLRCQSLKLQITIQNHGPLDYLWLARDFLLWIFSKSRELTLSEKGNQP
jgi:hypothetical protein